MAKLEGINRPLGEAEKRLLHWALKRRKRRLYAALRNVSIWGVVVIGGLWGISILATRADKRDPSWYVSGLIWLGVGIPLILWSYIGAKSDLAKAIKRFEGALRQNSASVIRIQPEQIAEFEEEEDEGPCYALQLSNGRIVFINRQQYYPSARFPNSDFSLVDIRSGWDGGC